MKARKISNPSGEIFLKTEDLSKQFPLTLANDCICFDVCQGEIHCLLGENGAGKSTLAECLYGFYSPDGGVIIIKDEVVKFKSPQDAIKLGIGMVHQHFMLVDVLTVIENVILGLQENSFFLDFKQAEARLSDLCEMYDLDLDLNAKIWQLSVGEQQWVEILKALYVGIDLLILDEPTAALTPQESERLFNVLYKMKEEGLAIIFITHKLKEVMAVSDRVTVLRKGVKIATVNTSDVDRGKLAEMMVGREVLFRVDKEMVNRGDPILAINDLHSMNDMGKMAVNGINLTLHQGEILGLAGVAGNGIKELFEVLIGLRTTESGKVIFRGNDITDLSPREIRNLEIGYIPEDRFKSGVVADFSVAENLILGKHRTDQYRSAVFLDQKKIKEDAKESVRAFDIMTPSVEHPVKYLSGGNVQKVILARELWSDPQLLLANQPTRGLDVGVIEFFRKRLLARRSEGVGILLASEDLDELFSLSDRIGVVFKGEVLGVYDTNDARRDQIGLLMAGIRED
jgi:ABC-type uncharacterized transport system ATPase subunit